MWAQYKKKTGLSPYKKLTQFILEKWTTDNGLHSNTLLDVYQTKDGYIWISGYNGLSRFDGIQFTVFNKTNVEAFYTNTTTALYQDRNGILWIGTEGGGLISYQNSVFTAYGREENFTYRIECLFEDRERNLWLGTRGAGVCRLVHKKIRPFEEIPEMKGTIVIAIAQDATGTLWFATHNKGLFSYQNGEHKQYTSQNGLPTDNTRALLLDSRGTLWVGTSNGILIKKTTGFEFIKGLENVYTNVLYEDALQNIWIGTNNNGIIRYNTQNGFIDYLPENKGIPHKVIKDITSDNEGNIWITTYRGGLVLLKDGKFTNYSELDGLSGKIVNLIYQESRERYLVCTDAGKVDV
ncbi:MAG: two-component regulator propeller domain-containing protein, partial [Flammeovirgaceae bacterium]|nr:two-component regulator propeller domain-containing protein [Flammeovirgaceae bacterium]